jgi:hypothetical protein
MPLWLYAALCVVVPAAWGVIMYFLFGFVDRRRTARRGEAPPIDYSI